ncbi:acyltransferase family protein [Amycolatopsis taiwanensis]|uniref:Acyltransferase n=1 Tax=Amycolatopsis taiwanensis TaxID=342230 RepID=A0A9W6R5J4_9PSEU|nr:acyltransferase [Amycolatopsis taiwanensis]GLY69494.1 acyltransferase [Amycolatopsis taiwanensis]
MPRSDSPANKPRRISWDAVRVVAVFSVMLGHITHQGPLAHPELDDYPFRITAQYGAAGLMVVSGFFVCQTIRRGHTRRWLWRKVARLLPPYLAAVVATYLVMRMAGAAFNGQGFGEGWWDLLFGPTSDGQAWISSWYVPVGWDLLVNVFMIQGWHNGFIWLDGSYWTLPVQLMIFAGAALLWSRARRLCTGRGVEWLAWAMIAGPLVLRFWILGVYNQSPWAFALVNGFGLHRMHAFAAGIGIWLWSRDRIGGRHLALLLVAAVCAQDLHLYPEHVALPGDPARLPSDLGFAVMLITICAAAKGPDWTFLRPIAPLITWLAGISYGVYLLHQELGYLLAKALLDAGFTGWIRLPIVIAAAVGLGWLLTEAVERPAFQRLTTGRRASATPAARGPQDDFLPGRPGPAHISVGDRS